ncbi:phage tail tape measure protein [Cribrihabitans sp. XS_ASV171]
MVDENTQRIQILLDLQNEAHDRAARASAREIAQLEKKYDPLSRATIRYKQEVDRLEKALKLGVNTQAQHVKLMDAAQREYDQTTAKIARQNAALAANTTAQSGVLSSVGRNRAAFQQLGYQVGDFAVQVQGGTSAVTAFTQQGSQLLGVIGPYGALAGAALAIGAPLAGSFLMQGEAAETLSDKLDTLSESVSDLRAAQDMLSSESLGGLGDLSDEAAEIFEINRRIAEVRAQTALDNVARGIAGELGIAGAFGFGPEDVEDVEAATARLADQIVSLQEKLAEAGDTQVAIGIEQEIEALTNKLSNIETATQNIGGLAEAFGIAKEEAAEVVSMFAAIGQAGDTREQAEAMSRLAAYINEVSGNLTTATDEGKALYEELLNATLQGLEMARIDYGAGKISEAANEAARLAENLAIAAGQRADAAAGGNVDLFDPRGRDAGSRDAGRLPENRPVPRQNRPGYTPPKTRTGRSGGGAAAADRAREAYDRLMGSIDPVVGAAQRLAKSQEIINEALNRGHISAEEAAKALDKVQAEYDEMVSRVSQDGAVNPFEQMERNVESLTESLLRTAAAGGSVGDALRAFLLDATIKAAAKNLSASIGGIFGGGSGGGGFLGSIFGAIFGGSNAKGNAFSGGKVTAFADGGVVGGPTMFPMAGGKMGLMGEAGAEAIMPLKRINGKLGVEGGTTTVRLIAPEGFTAQQVAQSRGIAVEVVNEKSAGIVGASVKATYESAKERPLPNSGR